MRERIRTKRYLVMMMVISLATIWMMSGPRRVRAIQDVENMPPPFGLAAGQTARLNILNTGEVNGYAIDWRFLDSMGRVVARSDGRTFIPTDQFRSFDVNGDSLDVARDAFGRIQLRVVVTTIGNPNDTQPKVAVEVLDNSSGKTTVFCANNL
ncbi:MAG TPA: hypothetical protein VGQ39_21505 [Pyrinomonadaceae bacterium]|nr:hypothetical protein [Pyrinomonadaceae bacterium]